MRQGASAGWLAISLLVAITGCAGNSLLSGVTPGQQQVAQQQEQILARQNQELQTRASSLDAANQKLEMQLAQAQQQSEVLRDQLTVMREQLTGVTNQLARIREEKHATEEQVKTLTASMTRQGGVAIQPNNSFLKTLPAINRPGVNVRRDGDVIRVEMPAAQLFDGTTARLQPGAVPLVAEVTAEILRSYPNHMVGIEGHTDSDSIAGSPWRNHNHLSVAWAMAIYDVLLTHTRLPPQQLFLVGHGLNHPVVSNATPEGKQRNRRVELVIYPELVQATASAAPSQ